MLILKNYNWPGNVRELENIVELMTNTESFPTKYFIENSNHQAPNSWQDIDSEAFYESLETVDKSKLDMNYIEKEHIKRVLKLYEGNITKAANALGIQRNTLYNKINKYQIEIEKQLL
jgi:transcriptional regulator with PAS, ATPase and Fis domain